MPQHFNNKMTINYFSTSKSKFNPFMQLYDINMTEKTSVGPTNHKLAAQFMSLIKINDELLTEKFIFDILNMNYFAVYIFL